MGAKEKNLNLAYAIKQRLGVAVTDADARTLRLCERTLSAWGEAECGDSNDYASTSIERDEETGKPFRVIRPHRGGGEIRQAIPDREAGALRRAGEVAERYGLGIYHQTDPRGCMLYIGKGLNFQTYDSNGVACYA